MSGMHQPIAEPLSNGTNEHNAVLHAIDFEDVALSAQGARLVHHGAREVMRQYMPASNWSDLSPAQAVALFIDRVFWEERTGGLIMCAEIADRSLCLPIPSAHWQLNTASSPTQ